MTLTDYNATLAHVKKLEEELAEVRRKLEKAVEDALPTLRLGGDTFRLSGSRIELDLSGNGTWVNRGAPPRTLDELRALADAFLPERKQEPTWWGIVDRHGHCYVTKRSRDDAVTMAATFDVNHPGDSPRRVVGLVEVGDA